ncbi:MAG: hypothetical protein ABFS28_09720 [Bacteroidota bacterium]
MKTLKKLFLFIAVLGLLVSCSKEEFETPELSQGDQETAELKAAKVKTEFTGVCMWEAPGEPPNMVKFLPNGKTLVKGSTTIWHDYADDPAHWMVTGQTIWTVNQVVEADGNFKYWGKAELIVDGEVAGDPPRGKWEMTWRGYMTGLPDNPSLIAYASGTGKEGAVKGLVAKWVYELDFFLGVYTYEGHYH